jgi:hypothetical protein
MDSPQLDRSELVVEHGSTALGRWVRRYRLRIAGGVALVEGLLVLTGAISWWAAVAFAVLVVVVYWFAGRDSRSYTFRQITWTAAVSQGIVVLVPLVFAIATSIAIGVVAIIAVIVLVALFTERS